MKKLVAIAFFSIAACAPIAAPAPVSEGPSPAVDCGVAVRGDASLMKTAPSADSWPRIDPPRHCTRRAAGDYIALHGRGVRRFDYQREPGPCDVPDADPNVCPTVSIHAFSNETLKTLKAKLGNDNVGGIGLGACGNIDEWNISERVHDWSVVDGALATIAGELDRWNIGDAYGLTVADIPCVVPI